MGLRNCVGHPDTDYLPFLTRSIVTNYRATFALRFSLEIRDLSAGGLEGE